MTIDKLRKRKQELAQKKQELECQPQSGERALLLEIVQEELMDINAQLRTLASHKCHAARRVDAKPASVDRQQFLNWRREDLSFDDEIEQAHIQLRKETVHALTRITPRQREVLEQKLSGRSPSETAQALGIAKGTVTSLASTAKKNVRVETERALAMNRLLAGRRVLDMMETGIMEAVLLAMTPTQAGYFYLYYSEGLSNPEIARLIGCDRTAVYVPVARALRNIDVLLDGQDVLLKHPEALDELGYQAYRELCAHPELAQADISPLKQYSRRSRIDPSPPSRAPYKWTIHVQVCKRRIPPGAPPGKLRAALMECKGDLFQALVTIFSVCRYKFEQHMEIPSPSKEGGANDS